MPSLLNDNTQNVPCQPQSFKRSHPSYLREANAFTIEFYRIPCIVNAEGLFSRLPFVTRELGYLVTPALNRNCKVRKCVSSHSCDERLLPVELGILPSVEFLLDGVVAAPFAFLQPRLESRNRIVVDESSVSRVLSEELFLFGIRSQRNVVSFVFHKCSRVAV